VEVTLLPAPSIGTTILVRSQLRIVDHFLRPAHGAERDMDGAEDLGPMRHRLRAEDLVENGRSSWGIVAVSFAGSENRGSVSRSGRSDGFGHGSEFVRRDKEDEPGCRRLPDTRSAPHCGFLRSCSP